MPDVKKETVLLPPVASAPTSEAALLDGGIPCQAYGGMDEHDREHGCLNHATHFDARGSGRVRGPRVTPPRCVVCRQPVLGGALHRGCLSYLSTSGAPGRPRLGGLLGGYASTRTRHARPRAYDPVPDAGALQVLQAVADRRLTPEEGADRLLAAVRARRATEGWRLHARIWWAHNANAARHLGDAVFLLLAVALLVSLGWGVGSLVSAWARGHVP